MAIVIKTLSDSSQARADLSGLQKSVEGIQKSTEGFAEKFTKIGNAIAFSAAAAGSAYGILKLSDAITNLDNRLNSVSKSAADAKNAIGAIYDISLRTRTSLDAVTQLFTKMTLVQKDLGASQAQIAQVTNTISEGFKISGASAENSRAAIVQLSQAFASGKLAGDEFNSVLENAPFLAQQITEGMGITLGQLYKLRDEGKLFARDVFGAILKQQDVVNKKFREIRVTFSDAFTNMRTSLFILAKAMSETILGADGFGLADVINNWALSIANFARNFRFYLLKAKTEAILFAIDVTSFFTDMWDMIVKDGPDAIFDFFAKMPGMLLNFISQAAPYAQRLGEIILSYADAVYTASSMMFHNFLEWLKKSERTAGMAAVLESMNERILDIGRRASAYFNSIDFSGLYDRIVLAIENAWGFIKNYDYSDLWSNVVKGLSNAFDAIKSVDVARFFPSLDTALKTVKAWAQKVVHWFWWIYDEVIGHSYIPDLIEGILAWTSKLMGGPLGFFKKFAAGATAILAAIKFSGVKGFSLLPKLLGGAAILTAGAAVFRKQLGLEDIFTKFGSGFVTKFRSAVEYLNDVLGRLGGALDPIAGLDKARSFIESPVKTLERNPITGNVAEKSYKRTLLADRLHIPRDMQVPIAAGLTGLVVAGLLAAMQAGTLRTVVISLFTTGALVGIARAIDQRLISEFGAKVTAFMLNMLNKGLNALLGKAVSEDPFGFLLLIAKFSLLFSAGREYFLGLAKTVATAPTAIGSNVANLLTIKSLGGELQLAERRLSGNLTKMDNQVVKAEGIFKNLVSNASNTRNRAGQPLGQSRAMTATQQAAADVNVFSRSSPEIQQAARQLQYTDTLKAQRDKISATGLDQIGEKKKALDNLRETRFQKVEAAKQGVRDFGGGVGGAVGTAIGFQAGAARLEALKQEQQAKLSERLLSGNLTIGGQALTKDQAAGVAKGEIDIKNIDEAGRKFAEIAVKEFEVSPWQEIGYTIGGAAGGQAAGALAGAFASGGIIWVAEKAGAIAMEGIKLAGSYARIGLERAAAIVNGILLAAPLLLVPALIVAAILAVAFLIYTYWDKIKIFLIAAGEFIVDMFMRYVNFWKAIGSWIVDKFIGAWGLLKAAASFVLDALMSPITWWTDTFPGIIERAFKWITTWWEKEDPKTPPEKPAVAQVMPMAAYATGGAVSGAGTGRSDSILAKLSNGEFVINAESARKHRGLLEAINDNQLPKFADGGSVGNAPIIVNGRQEQRRADYIGSKILSVQDDIKRLQEGAAKTQVATLRDAANRQIRELQRFVSESQSTQSLLDVPVGSYLKDAAGEDVKDSKGRKVRAARDAKDTGGLKFNDELNKLNELFPKLALSMNEFLGMTGEARAQLFELITPILADQKKIEDAPAGSGQAFDLAKSIEATRVKAQPSALDIASSFRSSASAIQPQLAQAGLEVALQDLQTFKPEFLKELQEYAEKQATWALELEKNSLDPAKIRDIRMTMNRSTKAVTDAIADQIAASSGDAFAPLAARLERAGVSVTRDAFNRLNDKAQTQVSGLVNRVIELSTALRNGISDQTARLAAQTELDANVEKIGELTKTQVDRAKVAGEDFTNKMKDSFSTGMFNIIRKGEFNLMDIASTFVDGLVKNFTDSLTSNLFNKEGLLGGIFNTIGRGSVLGDTSQTGAGSGLGGLFGGLLSKRGKDNPGTQLADKVIAAAPIAGSSLVAPLAESASKIGTDIGKNVTDTISKGTSAGGAAGGSLGGAFGLAGAGGSLLGLLIGNLFAEGGEVSGPGTGTSDSIPARLSNGEFVVRARQVKKYRPLLNAINDNSVPQFAEGGLVGGVDAASMSAVAGIAPISVSNDNSKAVVNNIAITGDISRQTKKEVYGMIPQIAAGVNAYNREKGIR